MLLFIFFLAFPFRITDHFFAMMILFPLVSDLCALTAASSPQQQHQQLAELGRKQLEQILQQLQEQLQVNLIQQTQLMQTPDKVSNFFSLPFPHFSGSNSSLLIFLIFATFLSLSSFSSS